MVERERWPESDTRGGTINDLRAEAPRTPAVSEPTSYRDTTRLPGSRQGELEGARVLLITAVIGVGFVLLIGLLLFLSAIL